MAKSQGFVERAWTCFCDVLWNTLDRTIRSDVRNASERADRLCRTLGNVSRGQASSTQNVKSHGHLHIIVATECNEVLDFVRLPFVVATTPYVSRWLRREKSAAAS